MQRKLIAFSAIPNLVNNFFSIYISDPENGAVRRISPPDLVCTRPLWSPDGTTLAYMCSSPGVAQQSFIRVTHLSGKNYDEPDRNREDYLFGWHPDGERLVIWMHKERQPALLAISQMRLEPLPWRADQADLSWTADGQVVAWTREKKVHMAGWDGKNERVLELDVQPIYRAQLSPDGKYVAFISREDLTEPIFIADTPSGQVRKVGELEFEGAFAWSPDSKRLAYVGTRDYKPWLYVVDAIGENNHELTPLTPGDDTGEIRPSNPAWSSDSAQIAYSAFLDDFHMHLFTVQPDGTETRRVPLPMSFDLLYDIAWQP